MELIATSTTSPGGGFIKLWRCFYAGGSVRLIKLKLHVLFSKTMATSIQQKLQRIGLELTRFWSLSPDDNALVVSNLLCVPGL